MYFTYLLQKTGQLCAARERLLNGTSFTIDTVSGLKDTLRPEASDTSLEKYSLFLDGIIKAHDYIENREDDIPEGVKLAAINTLWNETAQDHTLSTAITALSAQASLFESVTPPAEQDIIETEIESVLVPVIEPDEECPPESNISRTTRSEQNIGISAQNPLSPEAAQRQRQTRVSPLAPS